MQGKISSRNNEMAVWKFNITLLPSLPRKKIFPNVHGLLSFKDVISWTNFFWQAAMFSYTSITWHKDEIRVLLLLCLWVKCTQSRCQREKAANAKLGGGQGARDVDTRGGTKSGAHLMGSWQSAFHPPPAYWRPFYSLPDGQHSLLVLVFALVFLWLRINFWCQFQAEFCPNRAHAWTNSPVFPIF